MNLDNGGGDPTARRRLSRDDALQMARDIVRRHQAGESIRSISRAVGLPRTSCHRVIMQWRQALRDAESDVESAALLSKLEAGLSCEDLTEPEQIPQLNALELFRLGHLPADHPAHAAVEAAHEAGWRWPVREPASFPVGDGVLDRERAGW